MSLFGVSFFSFARTMYCVPDRSGEIKKRVKEHLKGAEASGKGEQVRSGS